VGRFDIAAEDEEHEGKILAWAKDRGVSLDWLLCGDHAGLIAFRAARTAPPRNETDPIFATIAAHREALMRQMAASRATMDVESFTPEYDAARAGYPAAREVQNQAESVLAWTRPSTTAGVLALLTYMTDFHAQAFELPEDGEWHSGPEELGMLVDDAIVDKFTGKPIPQPLNFWIMRNVLEALEAAHS
jgi:hypothetical protein